MSTAPSSAQRGMDCQWQAMIAFQNGRFREAYNLYIEAEALYRQARDAGEYWVTTRLFLMQSSVLRCLEELLDESPDLLDNCRSSAERFLDACSQSKISAEIKPDRVFEALAFRAWREDYLKGVHAFSAAAVASKRGDVANARRILEDFIERTKEGGDQENDALCALARSKKEMLSTQQELQKRPQERNVRIVVSGYLRAAKVSRLPVKSTSKQRNRFSAFRASFLSEALKFRAFDSLRQMRLPEPSLIKAQRYLARAVQYARRAASLGDFPKYHSIYLDYWHGLVSERVHLMAFMSRGDPADYDAALRTWQNATRAAEQLCEHADEESFFPNRFYSLDDLRLEGEVLGAARAFREKRWSDCAQFLESWREQLPQEFSWSWRDVNVNIRLLGAKTIDAIVSADYERLPSLRRDLMNASKSEPAGGAARYFAEGVARLPEIARNESLLNATLDSPKRIGEPHCGL